MTAQGRARRRIFPGWLVVIGAFLVLMVGFGAINAYAVFAEAIGDEFGADRASVSLIFALSGATCFFASAVTGPLADRLGPRVPAAIGMVLVGLGLVLAGTADSLIEIYAGYGLLVGLGTGFAYVPAMAAVQSWFVAHRGLASGIAASGIGVGTALAPAGAEALLQGSGWRLAFLAFGALAAGIGMAGALLLRTRPRRASATPPASLPRRAFLLGWCGVLLLSLPATLPHAMLVATAQDLGLTRADALALLGLIGLGTIAGRFLLAALADVAGRRAVFLGCCATMAGSMVGWAFAADAPGLQAFALLFGAVQGGFVALLPSVVADRFGARALGRALGLLYTSRGVALLLAPPALAAAIGVLDDHVLPLALAGLLGLIGTALLAVPIATSPVRPASAEPPRPPHPSSGPS